MRLSAAKTDFKHKDAQMLTLFYLLANARLVHDSASMSAIAGSKKARANAQLDAFTLAQNKFV